MEVINNLYSRCIRLFLSVSTTFGPLKYKTSIKRTKFSRGQQGDQGWSTCQKLVWDLLVPPGEGMALGGNQTLVPLHLWGGYQGRKDFTEVVGERA